MVSYSVGTLLRISEEYRPPAGVDNHLTAARGDLVEIIDVIEEDLGNDTKDHIRVINRSLGASNGEIGWIPKRIACVDSDNANQPSITISSPPAADPTPQSRPSSTLSDTVKSPFPSPSTPISNEIQQPAAVQQKNEVAPGSKFIARYEYQAQRDDELSLIFDDILYILASPEGGWWRGMKNPASKDPEIGWFPSNYVEAAAGDDREQLAGAQQKQADRQKSWYKKIIGTGSTPATPSNQTKSGKHNRSLSAGSTKSLSKTLDGSISSNLSKTAIPLIAVPENEDNTSASLIDSPRSAPPLGDSKAAGKFQFLRKQNTDLTAVNAGTASQGDKHKRRNTTTAIPDINNGGSGNTLSDEYDSEDDDHWRNNLTDEEFGRLSPQERHRQDVIWELISTERDYIRDLKIVVFMFLRPIVEKKLLSAKNIQLIFANIEDILVINQNFLDALEKRRSTGKLISVIGDILLDATEKFVIYAAYCCERQEAIQRLQKLCSSTKSLSTFLDETYSKSKATRGLDLASFLLKPIQRICKYPLLVKETIKYTPDSSHDHSILQRVQTKLQNVINIINQGTPSTVSNKRLTDIESSFNKKIALVSPSRYLVREDSIQLLYGEVKKPRQLFLFNDLVMIARKDWRDKLYLTEKAELTEIKITNVRHHNENMHVFELVVEQKDDGVVPVAPNRYLIAMPTKQAKSAWIESIVKLIGIKVDSKVLKPEDERSILTSYHPAEDEEDIDSEESTVAFGGAKSPVSPALRSASPILKRHTMTAVQALKIEAKGQQVSNSLSELSSKHNSSLAKLGGSSSFNFQASSGALLTASNASLDAGSNVAAAAVKNRVKDLEKMHALNELEIKRLTAKLAEFEKKNTDLSLISTNHMQQMTDLNAENMKMQHQIQLIEIELSDAQKSAENSGKELQMKEEIWSKQREQLIQQSTQDRLSFERKFETQKEEMRLIFERELQVVKSQADQNAEELSKKIEDQQQALDRKTEQISKLENDRLQQMMAFSQDMLSRAHGLQNADALQKNIGELQAALQISQDALVALENERNYSAEADAATIARLKVAVETANADYQNQQKSFEKLLNDRDMLLNAKVRDLAVLKASLAEISGCIKDLESEKQSLRRELEDKQKQLSEKDESVNQKEIAYMRQQSESQRLAAALGHSESTIKELRRELDVSRSKTTDLDSAINRMALEGQECQAALENCIMELKSNSLMFESLQSDYNECQSELSRLFEVEKEYERLKVQAGNQRNRILELENDKVISNGEIAELKHKLRAASVLKKKWKDAEVEKANLCVEVKALNTNTTSQSERIIDLERQITESEESMAAKLTEINELKSQLTTANTELKAMTIVLRDIQRFVTSDSSSIEPLESGQHVKANKTNQQLLSIVEQVHQLQMQRSNLTDDLEVLRGRCKDLEQLTSTQEAEMLRAIETIKSLESGAEIQRQKHKDILAVADDEKKRLIARIDSITSENTELARNGRNLSQKIEDLQEQHAKAQKSLINYQVNAVTLQEQIEKMQMDDAEREKEFLYQKGDLMEARSKVQQLEQDIREMQLYPNANQMPGMAQRLKDLESDNAELSKAKVALVTKLSVLSAAGNSSASLVAHTATATEEELKPSDLSFSGTPITPAKKSDIHIESAYDEKIKQLQQENQKLKQANSGLVTKLTLYAQPHLSTANNLVAMDESTLPFFTRSRSPSPQPPLLPPVPTDTLVLGAEELKAKFEQCTAALSNLSQLRYKYDQQIIKMLGIDKVNDSAQNILQYMETATRFETICQSSKNIFNKNLDMIQAKLREIESVIKSFANPCGDDQSSVPSMKRQLDEALHNANELRSRNQRLNALLAQSGALTSSDEKMPMPWQKMDVLARLVEQEWNALITLLDDCLNGQSSAKVISEDVRGKFMMLKDGGAETSKAPLIGLPAWQDYMDKMQTRLNGLSQLLGSLMASLATSAINTSNPSSTRSPSPSKLASGGVMRAVVKSLKDSDDENGRLQRHLEWCQRELERMSDMYHELQGRYKRKETELKDVRRSLQTKMEEMSEISMERANISQLVMKACDELENLV